MLSGFEHENRLIISDPDGFLTSLDDNIFCNSVSLANENMLKISFVLFQFTSYRFFRLG